ncbi:MAG: conjugal transfer protein TraF [Planctomycetes bacterium]|nr:conjugal transfer protein TraF [Planctomycetota bacterium]
MRAFSCLILAGTVATTASAQYFEARNSAMGGTGTASSSYLAAPLANPALLARFGEDDGFGLRLPTIGASAADEDDLVDAISSFQDELETFQARLDAATVTPADRNALAASLQSLAGRTATANFGASFAIAIPNDTLSVALFGNTYGDARVFATIDPNDVTSIQTATVSTDVDNLQSEGRVIGAAVSDLGISIAKSFDLGAAKLLLGASPKAQRVDSFNYSLNIDTFDEGDFHDSQYRNDEVNFNADAGAAVIFGEGITVGVMARNLVSRDYQTVLTAGQQFSYEVKPVVTIGAAVELGALTLTADVDVTDTERFNLSDESRFVRGGLEVDLGDWVQLRRGAQLDTEDTTPDLFTAGLGISPFGVFRLDLAGMLGEDNTYGAVLQTSFTF